MGSLSANYKSKSVIIYNKRSRFIKYYSFLKKILFPTLKKILVLSFCSHILNKTKIGMIGIDFLKSLKILLDIRYIFWNHILVFSYN